MSAIRFDGVTFRYELTPEDSALDGVSLELAPGSLALVTGPSGSGKSTLCRLIAGYAPHQFEGSLEGTVEVAGLNVAERTLGELSEHIGVVFEDPFDQLTGATRSLFDEVAFGLENRGRPPEEIERRVLGALQQVGLRDILARHPRELSGGQCQRLAIATVLALAPTILVLDEPTSQLDPTGSQHVVNLVSEMLHSGMTILVVAQDLARWLPHADRLICLDAGRVRANGTPRRVLSESVSESETRGGFVTPPAVTLWRRLLREGLVARDSEPPLDLRELAAALHAPEAGSTEI